MNQDSDDLSAYKFKIQHLPSFYWRTFGTALFGQQTLSHFMPNQNRNWPRIHEFSLIRSRRRKQLFWVATPSLRVFIQPALDSAWWENTVKFPYRVQIQLGRFASPHLIGWGGGNITLPLVSSPSASVNGDTSSFVFFFPLTGWRHFKPAATCFILRARLFFFNHWTRTRRTWWPLTLLLYGTHTSE